MSKRWVRILLLAAIVGLSWAETAAAADFHDFQWRLDSRFRAGMRLNHPRGLATLQQQAEYGQSAGWGDNWKYQLSARLRADAAYAMDFDRYGDLAKNDGPEVELRDANVLYRNGNLSLRVGSQLVVWGEAFGTFYADVVNPKDLREAGFGEVADFRKPIEMLNLQYIESSWSAQLLYVPFYRGNRLPRLQSDFFPSSVAGRFGGLSPQSVDFDQSDDPEDKRGDIGGRIQFRAGAFDVSLFGLDHIDRQPLFNLTWTGFTSARLRTLSRRTLVTGLTASWAGDVTVVRAEAVRFNSRSFNRHSGSFLSPLAVTTADQWLLVAGIDWPLQHGWLKGWQVGFQYSEDRIDNSEVITRSQREAMFGFQLFRDSVSGTSVNLFAGTALQDGSWLVQASALRPANENLEAGAELWLFEGATDSQLGSIRQGSRLMFIVKGAFSG